MKIIPHKKFLEAGKIKNSSFLIILLIYSMGLPILNKIINNQAFRIFTLFVIYFTLFLFCFRGIALLRFRFYIDELIIFLFVLYALCTPFFTFYLPQNVNVLFVYGVYSVILPVLGYLYGKTINDKNIIETIGYVGFVNVALAFLTYPPLTEFLHLDFLTKIGNSLRIANLSIEEQFGYSVRLRSLLDSMSFGNIAFITYLIFIFQFYLHKKKRFLFKAILSFIAVLLSFQRSAIFVTVLTTFIIIVFLFFKQRQKQRIKILFKGFLILVLIGITFSFIYNFILPVTIQEYFSNRIKSIFSFSSGDMLFSRNYQWKIGIEIVKENALGIGLGQLGQKAGLYKDVSQYIPDGNYFSILGELGIIGISLILLLFLFLLLRLGYLFLFEKKLTPKILVTLLLLGYFIQAIGTNVWDLFYINFIFWFLYGYLNRSSLLTLTY